MNIRKSNCNFAIGQKVVCTIGSEKGNIFEIVGILDKVNGYSCLKLGVTPNKYYEYSDQWLELAKE